MKRCKSLLYCLLFASFFTVCSKDKDSDDPEIYTGRYIGSVVQEIRAPGVAHTQQYDFVIDVSAGSDNNEINILFGSWVTRARLDGKKFIISETPFSGGIVASGNGEFLAGNRLEIRYRQVIGNVATSTYTGILTKF